jgi:hypothetical protein
MTAIDIRTLLTKGIAGHLAKHKAFGKEICFICPVFHTFSWFQQQLEVLPAIDYES